MVRGQDGWGNSYIQDAVFVLNQDRCSVQWQALSSLVLFLFQSSFFLLIAGLSWVVSPIITVLDTGPAGISPWIIDLISTALLALSGACGMAMAMAIFCFACQLSNLAAGIWYVVC